MPAESSLNRKAVNEMREIRECIREGIPCKYLQSLGNTIASLLTLGSTDDNCRWCGKPYDQDNYEAAESSDNS